jgi:hypothetical protein
MGTLVDALEHAYRVLGLEGAATSTKHSKPSSATAEVRSSSQPTQDGTEVAARLREFRIS